MSFLETSRAPLLVSIIAVSLLLVSAGTAFSAQRCEAPPGTSGTEQYCETLPAGTGDRPSTGGPLAAGSFDRRTQSTLERSGRDGRGVLELPSSGGRAGGSEKQKAVSRAGGSEKQKAVSRGQPSGSPFGSLGSALESGSTAGQGFIWLLVASGLGMVGIAWLRYRRGSSS